MLILSTPLAVSQEALDVLEPERSEPVDFNAEILPILRENCLACHNETDAEGELVLETVEAMMDGGATGAVINPGDGAASFLFQVSAHLEEPIMPPADNDVAANALTPGQLGLLKRWIDEGAKPTAAAEMAIEFEPLPPGLNPVYAVRVSADGQYLAAGRANQVTVYHLPTKREIGRLTDPELMASGIYENPGVAHLDLVQAIAISDDGRRIATGGFRNVKVWEREKPQEDLLAEFESPIVSMAHSNSGNHLAVGTEAGELILLNLSTLQMEHRWDAHSAAIKSIAFSSDGMLCSADANNQIRCWQWNDDSGSDVIEFGTSFEIEQGISALAFLESQNQLAIATGANKIGIYSFDTFERQVPSSDGAQPAVDSEDQSTPTAEAQTSETESSEVVPLRELNGHSGGITKLIVIDGQRLASAAADGTVRIWNLADGRQIRQLNHGSPIEDLVVNADRTRIVSCGENQVIRVWDAGNGRSLFELSGNLERSLADAAAQREVTLRQRLIQLAQTDLDQANQRKTAEDENEKKMREALTTAETEHTAKQEAFNTADTAKTAAEQALAEGRMRLETATASMAEATALIQSTSEEMTRLQQMVNEAKPVNDRSTQQLAATLNELKAATDALLADPQNLELISAYQERLSTAQTETATQLETATKLTELTDSLSTVSARKTGAEQARAAAQQEMQAANAAIGPAEQTVNTTAEAAKKAMDELTTATRNLDSARRSVDRAVEAVALATEQIPLFEAARVQADENKAAAEAAKQQTAQQLESAKQPLHAIWLADDQRTLFSMDRQGTVQSWDIVTGAGMGAVRSDAGESHAEESEQERSMFAMPVGERHLLAHGRQLKLLAANDEWSLVSTIGNIDGESPFIDRVTALDFSPDAERLAVGGGDPSRSGEVLILDLETNSPVLKFAEPHSDVVLCLRYSPDGKQIATSAADRFVKLFDAAGGDFVRSYEGHTHHVLGVGWSADGRTLVSASSDKTVKIWDALSGDQRRTITGFGKEVTGIQFVAQTGEFVVSCGDRQVLRKRTDNGGNVRGYGGYSDFVHTVDVTEDGQYVVAGGQDSVVRVWRADNGQAYAEFLAP